ncbi:hypothetical protein D3C84_999920 [compost metagenome]
MHPAFEVVGVDVHQLQRLPFVALLVHVRELVRLVLLLPALGRHRAAVVAPAELIDHVHRCGLTAGLIARIDQHPRNRPAVVGRFQQRGQVLPHLFLFGVAPYLAVLNQPRRKVVAEAAHHIDQTIALHVDTGQDQLHPARHLAKGIGPA